MAALCLPADLLAATEWSSEIELGYGYDSNVAVDDIDLNLSSGDRYMDLRLSGGMRYESALTYSADLTLSERRHDEFDEFDSRFALLSLGVEKEFDRISLGFDVRHVDYRLDGREFLRLSQFSPSIGWFATKNSYLRFDWEYSEKTIEQAPGRDSDQQRASLLGYYFFNGLKHLLTWRIAYADDVADSDEFDNKTFMIRLAWEKEINLFTPGSRLKLGYRYQKRDYVNANSLGGVDLSGHRRDRRHRYEVSVDWPITEKLHVLAEVFANDFRSNLVTADYSQRVYQLGIKYAF